MKKLLIILAMLIFPANIFADPQTPSTYTACGCGGCPKNSGMMSPMHIVCVSKEKMQNIVEEDKNYPQTHKEECAVAGCSTGERYQICR